MKRKILLSSLLTAVMFSSLNAGVLEKINGKSQNNLSMFKDIDENFVKPNIVKFIEENGVQFNEVISDTQNLRLDAQKIYTEGNNKAILIKVLNKTGSSINVEADVGEGNAYPKILMPHSTGYLVLSNDISGPVQSYDTMSYNDKMVSILSSKEITNIQKYFYSDIEIYKLNGVNATRVSSDRWVKDNIGKSNLFIVDRIDRVVDENSNRFGLYTSGFIKVSNDLYTPMSYYFIVNQGKIVKIFEKDEYLKFDDFKKLMLQLDK
jgi:hypothetical protein